ncbi:hypothetical protein C4552_04845 [Candidatus Parcubacteria bacterium]|nr:MAG: hypothetical protein C4552_04845 [Candidatus Parcubacteria bacterium]
MKGLNFPLFPTKLGDQSPRFALEDPVERRKYFDLKAGPEIEKLREYLRTGTFVGFLLGKKNSGKGTYSKLFMEAVGGERVAHLSVGDIVRGVHKDLADESRKQELIKFLESRYRGFITIEAALDIILGRDTKTLLPTEIIIALVEREIDRIGRKAIFIDGFPRNLDQISAALYFRTIIGYRDDPDFFVFIDLPDTVIDARMKTRVVCPKCNMPRSLQLLRTKEVGYDEAAKEFYLICDNPACGSSARMIGKEGDELGIEAIRDRVELDDKIMRQLLELKGVPKIQLRNTIPVEKAREVADDYEITPAYRYEWDAAAKQVRVIEEPWVINDDDGAPSHSLQAAPVVISLIKQMTKVLGL